MHYLDDLWQALSMALGMFWKVGWSLVFGFILSAMLQTLAPKNRIRTALGGSGIRNVALATVLGAISSSCSYASASISRTLFRKGAGFIPSLAFLFASTNLVIELGIVLYLLLGWQFMLAEWVGGIVLIVLLSLLVKATCPVRLIEDARAHAAEGGAPDHGAMEGQTHSLGNRATWIAIAANFAMDLRMLWKDLALGFLIAGCLAVFVPVDWWQGLFGSRDAGIWQLPRDAALGPLVAVISFVCSIGNVPMAAVLWSSGVHFGGVLSFLYADLIVLPLLDVYRRYYGLKMAAYMGLAFYVTMVVAGIVVGLGVSAMDAIPQRRSLPLDLDATFRLDHTLWLNVLFGVAAAVLFLLARTKPATAPACCGGHAHHAP